MGRNSLMFIGQNPKTAISVNVQENGDVRFITCGSPLITAAQADAIGTFLVNHAWPKTSTRRQK